ncbi:MAG: tail fiber protein [Bdellovibrionales bacterium]|nr:tail fiber protein [Bdellovibrionales bacterium]
MKKYIFSAIFVMVTSALYVNAQSNIMSLNFIAPQIDDRSYVSNPQPGEIVFDSGANAFYGHDSTAWTQLGTTAGSSMPSGAIVPFAGSTAPTGFLLADGSAVSRTTYSALFAIIGTTYGAGDGSTTFNLPDLRGIFVRGAGTQTVGSISYTGTLASKQNDQLQGHTHGYGSNTNTGSGPYLNFGTNASSDTTMRSNTLGLNSDGSNGTPRAGAETRPANISLTYIIKI